MPVIRLLPDPPSTTDPANFSSKADAHVLALQDFTSDVNNFAAALEAADVIAPSIDTITATATTTNLWNSSHIQNWTGTPTITDLPDAPAAGSNRVIYPAAGTIFTNNSNLSVQGGANYTVASGDLINIVARTVSTFDVFIVTKSLVVKDGIKITQQIGYSANTTIPNYIHSALILWQSSSAGTITLQAAPINFEPLIISNVSSGLLTIARNGTQVIYAKGASGNSFTLAQGESAILMFDGANWVQMAISLLPLGINQAWQDVTSSRAFGSAQTNNTGRSIATHITATMSSGTASLIATIVASGGTTTTLTSAPNINSAGALAAIDISCVPPDSSVTISASVGSATLVTWRELR